MLDQPESGNNEPGEGIVGQLARPAALVVVLAVLVAVLVIVGCMGESDEAPTPTSNAAVSGSDEAPTPTSNAAVNRIVYVDGAGQIRTVDPDGSNESSITPEDGFFTWPTWSPDASHISFSAVARSNTGEVGFSIYVGGREGPTAEVAYANEPGTGEIAEGIPHYSLWSPDSTRLAFIASAPEGLTLFVDDRSVGSGPQQILMSAPMWMAWSSDSQYLLVHGGPDHFLVDTVDGNKITALPVRSNGYRVPAWKPSAREVVFVAQGPADMFSLFVESVDGGTRVPLQTTTPGAAFLWSPSGSILAIAHPAAPGSLSYDRIDLLAEDGNERTIDVPTGLLAFFWSPDGSKLAYVELTDLTRVEGVVRWVVVDVRSGARRPVAEFAPTREQLTMFQFFDQYAYSHSVWSPDGRSLVFAGSLLGQGITAAMRVQPASQIFVVDTGIAPEPVAIAEGILGFWSPR